MYKFSLLILSVMFRFTNALSVTHVIVKRTHVHKLLHRYLHLRRARVVTGGMGEVAARVEHVEEGQNAVVVQILGLWHHA